MNAFSSFSQSMPARMPAEPVMPVWGNRPPIAARLGGEAPPIMPPVQGPIWAQQPMPVRAPMALPAGAAPAAVAPPMRNNLRFPVGGVNAFAMR